jgi:hypothetical protein
MYLGQATCGLAIVNDRRYLQFQQITPHCLKLRHPSSISFNDVLSGKRIRERARCPNLRCGSCREMWLLSRVRAIAPDMWAYQDALSPKRFLPNLATS